MSPIRLSPRSADTAAAAAAITSAEGAWPASACSTAAARVVTGTNPPSATATLPMLPPATLTEAATPTTA